ncbi:fas apoptotic inhibitory molecule 1-like [Poecilia reticulata]|uniref:fas apoptotic inhibitory molecule 1-like n=1 Tax=Poecilia reticulata TaxID=8081 RepID=UPI0004A448C7|nr:PREDICTED: fas apoptotic inhibitory molecule 1-like [Poecilia reticulata]
MPCGDAVAVWDVALSDGVYRVEFAHGTTTGKRVVYVNGTVRSESWTGPLAWQVKRSSVAFVQVWDSGHFGWLGEFVDDGTETHFTVGEQACCIKATSGGKKKNGIDHSLLLDGLKVPASSH